MMIYHAFHCAVNRSTDGSGFERYYVLQRSEGPSSAHSLEVFSHPATPQGPRCKLPEGKVQMDAVTAPGTSDHGWPDVGGTRLPDGGWSGYSFCSVSLRRATARPLSRRICGDT